MNEPTKNQTVIVIEDESTLLDAITRKLTTAGFHVQGFGSAKTALDHLRTHVNNKPSIIWLDYYLEDMNGIEFMTELQKDNELKNIPVLVISNSANEEKVSTMKALGVRDYLIKANYRLEDLVNLVRKYAE